MNAEVGVKYDVSPSLQLTGALFDLDRTNQRIYTGGNSTLPWPAAPTPRAPRSASTATSPIGGRWRGGYAFTDARITGNLTDSILRGNTVALVPQNAYTLWNRFDLSRQLSVGIGFINHRTPSPCPTGGCVCRAIPASTRASSTTSTRTRASRSTSRTCSTGATSSPAHNNNNIMPGAPRTVRAQLIVRW